MRKSKGITLIEIIVVVALLSILLLVATPKFDIVTRFSETHQIREVKRDLLYAKTQAIVSGNTYNFDYDTVNNLYRLIEYTTKESVVKKVYLKDGLKFKSSSARSVISFSPTGPPSNASSFRLVGESGKTYKISITPVVGKVNIEVSK